jgi:hypothetical protein
MIPASSIGTIYGYQIRYQSRNVNAVESRDVKLENPFSGSRLTGVAEISGPRPESFFRKIFSDPPGLNFSSASPTGDRTVYASSTIAYACSA